MLNTHLSLNNENSFEALAYEDKTHCMTRVCVCVYPQCIFSCTEVSLTSPFIPAVRHIFFLLYSLMCETFLHRRACHKKHKYNASDNMFSIVDDTKECIIVIFKCRERRAWIHLHRTP